MLVDFDLTLPVKYVTKDWKKAFSPPIVPGCVSPSKMLSTPHQLFQSFPIFQSSANVLSFKKHFSYCEAHSPSLFSEFLNCSFLPSRGGILWELKLHLQMDCVQGSLGSVSPQLGNLEDLDSQCPT